MRGLRVREVKKPDPRLHSKLGVNVKHVSSTPQLSSVPHNIAWFLLLGGTGVYSRGFVEGYSGLEYTEAAEQVILGDLDMAFFNTQILDLF